MGNSRHLQATLICTDLIFTYFLCPAITNPEPLGIIADTPISHVARFNLMQVGQILQTLALAPFEQPQPQFAPLYEQFDQVRFQLARWPRIWLIDSFCSSRWRGL
jgi:hypothetical protein